MGKLWESLARKHREKDGLPVQRGRAAERPAYEKRHPVEIVDGRGLYHEEGFLILEDYPFRQHAVWTWLAWVASIVMLPFPVFMVMEDFFRHPVIKGAGGWLAFFLIFNRCCAPKGDTVLLETRGSDIYFGSVRVGRPKYARYDFGWSPWGYAMFVYDDDAAVRPRRVFFASLRRDSVRRVAAAVDRYLAGGAPERSLAPGGAASDPTVWPPAPSAARSAAGETVKPSPDR